MKVLNEEINKDIFGIEKKIEFEIDGEIYNYEGFSQSKSTYLNKIFDKKNDLILNEICDLDDYILFVNKDVIDEKLFDELNETNIVKISKESYQNAESFTPVESFCKSHEKDTNTDIYKISNDKKAPYVKVENFMFKHNGVFYKIKENYNEFELSRYNPKTNKSNLISEFSVSNNKNDGFYQDFELHGKKTKKIDEILNKVNNYFSLDLNLNIGEYHKAIYDACPKNNNTQIATLVMYDNGKAQSYFFKKNENEMQIKKDLINIYEEKKETIIGTEIKQIKYNSEHFTEDLFNLFKSDKHLSNFIEENNYSDVIKDGTDISNEKEKNCNEIDR